MSYASRPLVFSIKKHLLMSCRVKSVSHRDILESSPSPSRTQLDCEQEVQERTVGVLKTVQLLVLLVVIGPAGRGRSSYLVALAF